MRFWCDSNSHSKTEINNSTYKMRQCLAKNMFMWTWINSIMSVTAVMTYDTIGHLSKTQNGNHIEWVNERATKNTEYKLKIISKYIPCVCLCNITPNKMWNKCNFNAIWFSLFECVCLFGRPPPPLPLLPSNVSCPLSSRSPFQILSGIFSVSTAIHVIRK